jgi:DNA-binding MarR family transcriptional regulator
VALVLSGVPTHVRNRLVRLGVPFVVPDRQMFLPFLAVDLRERDPRLARATRQVLSTASQVVVLRHLLGKPAESHTLAELAAETGYSAMTMTNVGKELASYGLCEVIRDGRAHRVVFGESGRPLWERALPHLGDPVRTRRWVQRWKLRKTERIAAGISALARYTSIADDEIPTFALGQKEYRARVENGSIVECAERDEAEVSIECWSYDPAKLTEDDCVDRLSLYLSLRNAADERVHKELGALMEGLGW